MSTLTKAQIHATAVKAGFTDAQATIITAISMAESGGNTRAHNGVPPDNSYGLTQVNMLGNLGTARRKAFGLSSNDDLYDPLINMKAAYEISGGGKNWRPWSTYLHGTYRKFLSGSDDTSGTAAGDGKPDAGGGAEVESAGLLSGATSGILSGAEKIVYKGGFLLLGVALIGAGVIKVAWPGIKAAATSVGPGAALR